MNTRIIEATYENMSSIIDFWSGVHGVSDWIVEDIYIGLAEKFIRNIVLTDVKNFETLKGKPVLYLANHQTAVESLLFIYMVGGLSQTLVTAIAKQEHTETWLGKLHSHSHEHPNGTPHNALMYFDRSKPVSFIEILRKIELEMKNNHTSILIHTEGTRALTCRQETTKVNRRMVQLAIQANIPIVPIRFIGGLPIEESDERTEFPIHFGTQDFYVGSPIFPEEIKDLEFSQQKEMILQAINHLGMLANCEKPNKPDLDFSRKVEVCMNQFGVPVEFATILKVWEMKSHPSPELLDFLERLKKSELTFGQSPMEKWLSGLADCLQMNHDIHRTKQEGL
ncbi:lysophospholipid acyltransferase family protein [Neobacillus cucumis]|uniref:Phospholipid/glycerol acyltransferase domain-containing protein n=1 Tax=Neobacillus cucumis TaxID=1740721 RepID=A0A2N5H9W9_9BACI|nr:lysophospholipid acyltransferase family protein [Neobacillus cucumis]PLS02326.1 hypothetical protein CVD27_20310 [Neobacillus cucumis]